MTRRNSYTYYFLIACLLLLGFSSNVSSQSVTASADNTFFDCGGGVVQLSAVGLTSSTVFADDFNTGQLQLGWTTNNTPDFSNPCGASFDGTPYLWMGSGTSAPRSLTTASTDVSCGGTICFDFKFMCEYCGDSAPCEGADFYNEGVSVQYSNGGGPWTDIAYFAPNGNLLTSYPGAGASSPIAFGATNFTTWNNYCFPIPVGGQSANTQFRLFQWGSSGANYDHWGIDNVVVTATPCTPFYYDWLHIPGNPDAADVTTNVTQTTTFTVNYTDGTTTYSDQITITVDNLEFDNLTNNSPSCYGLADGSISATMLNGLPPYTYNLSGAATASNNTGNFTGLAAGLYVLEVIDAKNCPVIQNITIPQGPSCCEVSASGVDPTCSNVNDGSILSTPSGGIPSYTYQWYTIANVPIAGAVSQSIGNIGAGDYIIEIQDVSGCINRDTVTLTAPPALTGSLTLGQINCFGVCDASIDMTNASGGTPPYEYALNNNNYNGSSLFTGLCQGNYTYRVKDANDCILTNTTSISEPGNLLVSTVFNNDEICSQGNGEFQLMASGGIGPYTYTTGGVSNNTGLFQNLSGGVYPVSVEDQNGCVKNISITVVDILAPNPVIDYQQDVACAGGLNGAVTVVVSISTGTPPFTYNLNGNGPLTTNTFNVNAGSHSIVVADANLCSGTVSFSIGQPSPLNFTIIKTDATCNALCNGTVTVSASGGTPPYEYSKDNGLSFQSSPVLTNLCPGPIFVVVKDANGCLANTATNIGHPLPGNSSNSVVDPTCYNGCDGSISFGLTTGGTGAYDYSIDGGATYQASAFFTNICAGTYDLIARDANNCEVEMLNVAVNNPLQIQFNDISETGSNCGFANGGFEVQAVNGTAAYTYSLDNSFTVTQPTGNFTNLSSGIYTVYVEDANNCVDSTQEDVSDIEISTALDSIQNVTCYGGTDGGVFVSITNGLPPITFTLDSIYFQNVGVFDGATDPNVQLSAGTHFVIIHDSGNCSDFYEFVITEPDSITFDTTIVSTSCLTNNDGQITFNNVLGGDGGPYTYSIDNGANFFPSNSFTNLAAGTYNTVVRDGNGCSSSMTVDISQPSNIGISINPTNLVCHGDNTGSIILVASGGAGGFNYDIGTSNNATGIFFALPAQTYNIQVTDANGCTKDTTHTLTEPDTLDPVLAVTDNLCFGDCSGEVNVAISGGTPPYLYSSDGGTNQQASNILGNLCAGIHTIEIEDFKNCTYTVNQMINSPADLTLAVVGAPATCGLNNGTITANANGGTLPYSYAISDDNGLTFTAPVLSNIFNNLAPNSYIVKIIDGNLCEEEMSIVLNADPEPSIDFVGTTDILCNGETSGQITVTSGLGVGIHEFSLDNILYSTNNTFTNLGAGNYTVYVRDGNNCVVQQTTSISEPPLLISNVIGTDLTCFNDFSGEISITTAGGVSPYQYSIDNGASFQPFGSYDFLQANAYTTIVTDANNCSETVVININEPAAITTNIITTNVSCFGACDGTVDLNSNGGTGNLTYQWSGNIAGVNDDNAINVCAGNYNTIITDANGCFIQVPNINVAEPPQLVINSVVGTNVSCFNACDGEITVDAPLGVTFDLLLNGVPTTNATGTFNNLCDENYDVVVTDIQGCQAFSNTTITQPDALIGNAPSDWTNVCFNSTINVSAGFTSGGTLPFTYNWSDDYGNVYPGTSTFSQTVTQNNIFTYNIVDANGCTAGPYSFNMTVTPALQLSPTTATEFTICPGSSVNLGVMASQGQRIDFGDTLDYAYSWNTGNVDDTLSTVVVSPAANTTYTVTATDYCNESLNQTFIVNVYQDPNPQITPTDAVVCVGEAVSFENTLEIPGTSTWTFSNSAVYTGKTVDNVVFTEPGRYDLTVDFVSDSGNCSGSISITDVISINPLPKSGFTFDPLKPRLSDSEISFTSLAIGAESYFWTFGKDGRYGTSDDSVNTFEFSNFDFIDKTSMQVCLEVTNIYNCTDTYCEFITIQEDLLFYIPNSFTPGSGGTTNNEFKPVFTSGFDRYQYELLIFNRWGEIIFRSNNPDEGWDGRYGNKLVEQAAYVWKITYEDTFEDIQKTVTGHVTLLR